VSDIAFDLPPDYTGIASAAGGALALTGRRPEELEAAVACAFEAVRQEKRAPCLMSGCHIFERLYRSSHLSPCGCRRDPRSRSRFVPLRSFVAYLAADLHARGKLYRPCKMQPAQMSVGSNAAFVVLKRAAARAGAHP
jgi:hypothetical protein